LCARSGVYATIPFQRIETIQRKIAELTEQREQLDRSNQTGQGNRLASLYRQLERANKDLTNDKHAMVSLIQRQEKTLQEARTQSAHAVKERSY